MKNAKTWIDYLQLLPHPEGGYYKELYRSEESIEGRNLPGRFKGSRSFSTAIYYLLNGRDISHFHKINQDELWHFYDGSSLLLHILTSDGKYLQKKLGLNLQNLEEPLLYVKSGDYFAAEVLKKDSYTLAGCTVSPGFDFRDFTMPHKSELIQIYPEFSDVIKVFGKS